MRKLNIWDFLFYVAMLVLTIWTILKSVGVIKTLLWIQYGIPLGSLIISVFALYYNLINNLTNLNIGFATLSVKFGHLKKDVHMVQSEMNFVKKDVALIKSELILVKKDVEELKAR